MNKIEALILLCISLALGGLALYAIWIVDIPTYAKYMISIPTIIAFGGAAIASIIGLFKTNAINK